MEDRLIQSRRDHLAQLTELDESPFSASIFQFDSTIARLLGVSPKERIQSRSDQTIPEPIHIAGRLIALRSHGKTAFGSLQDSTGQVQIYIKQEDSEFHWKIWSQVDIGDILAVSGFFFISKTGEVTLRVMALSVLSKCLRPLPKQFFGLADIETRRRQRYLDCIMNPQMAEVFRMRSRVLSSLRSLLQGEGFIELETPILERRVGGR